MNTNSTPDFTSHAFLEEHAQFILAFYENRVQAPAGYYQCFKDNGDVYDEQTRHLVSSTRFTFNYANAFMRYGHHHHKRLAQHGLKHLLTHHKQANGNYAWELHGSSVSQGNAMAYGHAFVMLCASACVKAGITDAEKVIDETWAFTEEYFWYPSHEAYADERNADLTVLDPYRGQNANMHMCEALIAAWHTTHEQLYLERAHTLTNKFCFELAQQSNGLIWEHYNTDWQVDMQYNIDKPDDLFKPWGFQPGHQVEWSKLLLQLNEIQADQRWVDKAVMLFDTAMEKGWDKQHGGLVYGFGPDDKFADTHKYFWVHAEAIAAAWRLYKVTNKPKYLEHYNALWQWSWDHLIDHQYGAWYRIRNRDGSAFDDLKSPPGKTDYHTLGAVWDVLDTMQA